MSDGREQQAARFAGAKGLRLHLGGWDPKPGWLIVNVEDRPHVDVRSTCSDLSMFPDGSVAEIYASHVYEHLGYQQELPTAFGEAWRVLMPGGTLMIAVPDLEILAGLILQTRQDVNAQWHVQRMVMGGQVEPFDFHKVGFTFNILCGMLTHHGFRNFRRVRSFGLYKDTSELEFGGVPISLNVQCMKPTGAVTSGPTDAAARP
jgi:predicted SAM-dependent methyltransferase